MTTANARVTLDLVRDATSTSNSVIDLTPYFQGRVGDSRAPMPMRLLKDGRIQDLTSYTVGFKGTDSQGLAFSLTNCAVETGPGDSFSAGRFTWNWPAQAFQSPGEWSSAYFYVAKESTGEVISTLNVNLNVLEQAVSMDTLVGSYSNRLEDEVAKFQTYVDQNKDSVKKILSDNFTTYFNDYQQLKTLDDSIQEMAKKGAYVSASQLSQDKIDDESGAVPTPGAYVAKGENINYHSYTTLKQAGITPGTTVSDTSCDDIVYLETTVLNGNRVIQTATVTSTDVVWKLYRRNKDTSTWQDWKVATMFY